MTHPTETASSPAVVGLDVGDRITHLCRLDHDRQVVERHRFPTTREGVLETFGGRPPCRIVIEVGSQSPWLSSLLRSLGHEVQVADARRTAALSKGRRKTDRRDAETLARLLAGMPELLGSIHHREEQAQADLAVIRARDVLVRMRTKCVTHARSTLKVFGLPAPKCSAPAFHRAAREWVPESLLPALEPILDQLAELELQIRRLDKEISKVATKRYPETQRLREVNGVGPITSLAFVLTVEDPSRFKRSRAVGSWLGLCPAVDNSGDREPHLSISKTGNPYLRRLLIQSAQYILGAFGKDCDLRRYGERIGERGGKAGRRRAVVAVARKLGVLLHRLWVGDDAYDPLRNSRSVATPLAS